MSTLKPSPTDLPNFTFDMPASDRSDKKALREIQDDAIEAFEHLDTVAGARPSRMYVAYRTIKIGQVAIAYASPDKEIDYGEWLTHIIREVLVDYPIGKDL